MGFDSCRQGAHVRWALGSSSYGCRGHSGELHRLLKIGAGDVAPAPSGATGELEPATWVAATSTPPWVGRRLLRGLGGGDELLRLWPAVAGHPPRPPTDGLCDLQASIADCSCGELDWTPASCTSLPENVGSGKFGTPWARRQWAQVNHACCWAAESCWPVEFHGDGKSLHAWRAPWNAAEFGSIPGSCTRSPR